MSGLEKEYDIIVVGGGGINGLACAAYLQKAGLKVAVFERRDEVGTFCSTEEVMHPGVKVNIHATFIVTQVSPAFEELELRRFGYEPLTSSEWGRFHPFKDKSAVLWHSWDVRKQVEAWTRLSQKDGETLAKLANYLAPHWSDILKPKAGEYREGPSLTQWLPCYSKRLPGYDGD
jgi:phytoene dehydrogenase-like protein